MAKTLDEFRTQIKPEIQAKANIKARKILAEMTLSELRKAQGLKQTDLVRVLQMAQPNISQLEKRNDLLLSTLDSYVRALGGKLEIHAAFPNGENIKINYPL